MQADNENKTVVRFERSNFKLWLAALFLAVCTPLGILIATTLYANSGVIWPWFICLIPGIMLAMTLLNLLRLPRVIYEVTDRGITLFNVSNCEISWQNVKSVSVMSVKGTSLVVLNFTPDFRLKRFNLLPQKSIVLSNKIVRAKFAELLRVVREAHSNFHDGADPAS